MESVFTQNQKSLLVEFKRAGIVMFGNRVRTKYGLNSPVYLDLRENLYERADLLWKIGGEFFEKICTLAGQKTDQVVIGVPDTATPLALSTVLYSWKEEKSHPMHYLLLRKEAKVYSGSSPSYVIGKKDCRGCEYNLIDDVVASGLSKWKSIQTLKKEGITVHRIIAFFDRQQGGTELLEKEGYSVYSVFKLLDVVAFYLQEGLITEAEHRKITEFIHSRQFNEALWEK